MTAANACPQCGAELPADAPSGICPKCLLAAGLASDTNIRVGRSDDAPTTPLPHSSRFVPPSPAELSRHFPQLEILELIGAGGMGAVYKARQPGLDRTVAMKILPPEVGADPSFAQRFMREAQALARLGHQHIVSVYDFGEAGGLYYFIMEYVDGANLRQVIKSGELTAHEALAIVPQICEALQFAHDEGVVHRDIKPENILIDKRGRVKIADFGLARLLGAGAPEVSLTGTNQVLGTLHYMAPEQIQGLRTVDHRADIYSLGVVFYEMLTGELPLGRFAPPSQKVELDVRLDEVVLRSLESEPQRRYQRVRDVKTDVESISQLPPPAQTPPPAIRTAAIEQELNKVRKHVRFPGALLLVTGVVSLVLVAQGLGRSITQHGGNWSSFEFSAMEQGMIWAFAVMFAIPLVMIVGAVSMLRLTSYWWAIAAGVMTFFPFSLGPLWLLAVPLGVWTLVVLSKDDVKQGFALRKQQSARALSEQGNAQKLERLYQQPDKELPIVEPSSLGTAATSIGRAEITPLADHATASDSMVITTPAARSIKKLSNFLLEVAALGIASVVLLLLYLLLYGAEPFFPASKQPENFSQRPSLLFYLTLTGIYALFAIPHAVIIATSAFFLQNRRGYWFCIFACILAMVPVSLAWPIGLPIGLWGLAVLTSQEVRSAFAGKTTSSNKSPSERLHWPAIALITAGAVDFAEALFFGFVAVVNILHIPEASAHSQNLSGARFPTAMAVILGIAALLLGGLRVGGGMGMLRLGRYTFVSFASLASLLPVSLGAIFGLPAGIWALIVLMQSDVKVAFAREKDVRALRRRAERMSHESSPGLAVQDAKSDRSFGSGAALGMDESDDERQRAAELAEIAPDRVVYAALLLFGAGWTFVGMMWNFRWPGLVVAIAVMAGITFGIVRWKLAYLPKLRSELARVTGWRRGVALAMALAVFVVAMLSIIAFQVNFADTITNASLANIGLSELAGKTEVYAKAIVKLAKFEGLSADNISLTTSAARFNALPGSNVLMSGLCGFLFFFCAANALIDTRRYRYTWKLWWSPTLWVVLWALAMLPMVHFLHLAIVGYGTTTIKPREIRFAASLNAVDAGIDRWATQKGYVEPAYHDWRIASGEKKLGQLHMAYLSPTSYFERYRASWAHVALRPQPPLKIWVVVNDDPAQAYVRIELPPVAMGSPEETLWPELLDGLEAEILAAAETENKGGTKQ